MKPFPYWQALEPSRRFLYLFLTALVVAVIGLGVYGYAKGDLLVFPLIKQAELFPAEAHLFPSSHLLTPTRVEVNAYLVSEQYAVGDMQLPQWAVWTFLAGLGVALTAFWTVASTLRRIPFYVAVSLGMLWLSTFNLDLLEIFSGTSRTLLLIALAALGGSSFLFHTFWPQVAFWLRFLFFSALVLLLGGALFYASPLPAELTAFHLVNYSTLGAFVAAVLFMILVAYENLHGLLWFNTQAQQPQRRFGLPQFLLITVLYLGNLLLLYLRQTGVLDLDFAGLDALVVFLISAVVGLWGLQQRQVQYARFMRFETEAAPLYLVLALLTFLGLGYAFLMANDPMVNAYKSAIILTHLSYGVAFWLYLLMNFGPLIRQKLRVYRVVYDPKRLPYFMVYLAGSVILVVLVLRSNYAAYHQAKAGYYNYLGDLYLQTEEKPLLAEQFYTESSIQARLNLRANFSLADMYHQAGMRTLEMQQLQDIASRKPTPEGYLRMASLYTGGSDLFEHLAVLQSAVKQFPENAPLLNNLALLYGTTKLTDSAAHYLDAALAHSPEPEVIQANQLAFLFKHGFIAQAKEFSQQYAVGAYAPLQTNRLAIAFLSDGKIPQESNLPLQDSLLTTQTFAHFYLRQLAEQGVKESASALPKVNQLLRQEANQGFFDDLTLLKGILQYRAGQFKAAKATLDQLATNNANTTGHYYDVLGQWFLQFEQYALAADYFAKARSARYPDAPLHEAVALALTGKPSEAAQIALQTNALRVPWQQRAATQLAIVTQLSAEQTANAPDSLKVRFLQLKAATLPLVEMETVANQITTPALAPVAALPLVARYLKENNLVTAQNLLNIHFPATFPKTGLKSKANVLQAQLWWQSENWQALKEQLPQLYFTPQDAGTKTYYQALLAQRNKKPKEATHLFQKLLQQAPWSEEGHLAAADFYVAQKQPLKAYDLLLEGISFNPTSTQLRKAFVRVALEQGLREYALQGLEGLEPLVSPAEYLIFKKEIDAKLQASDSLRQGWQ
ncbi:MAG: tetratricopeptide repeat protein [Rufibacter sp.]